MDAAGAFRDKFSELRQQVPMAFVSRDVTKRYHVMTVLQT